MRYILPSHGNQLPGAVPAAACQGEDSLSLSEDDLEQKMSPEELQSPFRTAACAIHGISIRGLSHESDGLPLQDSFAAAELGNGWIVLAVADGVGSEPKAQEGARTAAAAAVNHLRRFWGFRKDDQSIERMMRAAYHAACAELFALAMRDRAPLHSYSTTLHTVIFSDGLLYIMHAGDGGVVILTEEGAFQRVTAPMKGPDGSSVIPLQGGPDSWQFSVFRERAQSVAVMTDGIWDKFCPPILTASGDETGIETSIASFFMSPWARDWQHESMEAITAKETLVFRGELTEAVPEFYNTLVNAVSQGTDPAAAKEIVKDKVAPGNIPVRLLRGIHDDITILTLVRFDPLPAQTSVESFSPTDWSAVNQWAQAQMYGAAYSREREDDDTQDEMKHQDQIETNAEESD